VADNLTETPNVYTITELATVLRIDPATVRRNTIHGAWPHRKFGPKTIRFTDDDLHHILDLAKLTTPTPATVRRIGTRATRRTN
jgi:hypothetical protein